MSRHASSIINISAQYPQMEHFSPEEQDVFEDKQVEAYIHEAVPTTAPPAEFAWQFTGSAPPASFSKPVNVGGAPQIPVFTAAHAFRAARGSAKAPAFGAAGGSVLAFGDVRENVPPSKFPTFPGTQSARIPSFTAVPKQAQPPTFQNVAHPPFQNVAHPPRAHPPPFLHVGPRAGFPQPSSKLGGVGQPHPAAKSSDDTSVLLLDVVNRLDAVVARLTAVEPRLKSIESGVESTREMVRSLANMINGQTSTLDQIMPLTDDVSYRVTNMAESLPELFKQMSALHTVMTDGIGSITHDTAKLGEVVNYVAAKLTPEDLQEPPPPVAEPNAEEIDTEQTAK